MLLTVKTVRNIVAEVGVLPRAHGSALFTRGAGLSRMRGGGCQGRQVDVVSAQRKAEAGRNCGVFLDYLQVAQASRQGQHQGDEGPAPDG